MRKEDENVYSNYDRLPTSQVGIVYSGPQFDQFKNGTAEYCSLFQHDKHNLLYIRDTGAIHVRSLGRKRIYSLGALSIFSAYSLDSPAFFRWYSTGRVGSSTGALHPAKSAQKWDAHAFSPDD